MSSIPNELKINMNTNMPGYAKLFYKPNMCVKDSKAESVEFNPLVKYNSNIIEEAIQKFKTLDSKFNSCELFTNKEKFNTLMVMHKNQFASFPVTLDQATRKGYISNNISLTLKYLFTPKNLILLKGEPYTVGAYNWTTDDWALEVKEKLKSRTMYPDFTISPLITSGEKQLERLKKFNPNLVQGANYTPDKEIIAAGFDSTPSSSTLNITSPQMSQNIPPKPPRSRTSSPPVTPPVTPIVRPTPIDRPTITPPVVPPPIPPRDLSPYPRRIPRLPYDPTMTPGSIVPAPPGTPQLPSPTTPSLPGPGTSIPGPLQITDQSPVEEMDSTPHTTIQPEVFDRQQIARMKLPKLLKDPNLNTKRKIQEMANSLGIDISTILNTTRQIGQIKTKILNQELNAPTKMLQKYFKNENFYKLVNSIYLNLTQNQQLIVNTIFSNQTSINIKKNNNLSRAAYNSMVESMNVIQNTGRGDCFFIAVSDAINNYNYNKNTKITYNGYGIVNKIFTVQVLRSMVYQYLVTNQNQRSFIFIEAEMNNNHINNEYLNIVNGLIQSSDFSKTTEDILNQLLRRPNFPSYVLINPLFENKPINSDFNPNLVLPFISVNNNNLKSYIESPNYWADHYAVMAIYHYLQLNIFVLTNIDTIANPHLNMLCVTSQFVEEASRNNWNKYMFLYHSNNNHYELIVFNFESTISSRNTRRATGAGNRVQYSQLISIYDKASTSAQIIFYIVPFYLILMIFGSCYIHSENTSFINTNNQSILSILKDAYVKIINNDNITITQYSFNSERFIQQFIMYFPDSERLLDTRNQNNLPSSSSLLGNLPVPPSRPPRGPVTRSQSPEENSGEVTVSPPRPPRPPRGGTRSQSPGENSGEEVDDQVGDDQAGGAINRYPPYMRPFYNNFIYPTFSNKNTLSESSICYLINIELFLRKGTTISKKELNELKCSSRGYNIQKSFDTIIGTQSGVRPNFNMAIADKKNNETPNNNPQKENTQKNSTQKYKQGPIKKSNNNRVTRKIR